MLKWKKDNDVEVKVVGERFSENDINFGDNFLLLHLQLKPITVDNAFVQCRKAVANMSSQNVWKLLQQISAFFTYISKF